MEPQTLKKRPRSRNLHTFEKDNSASTVEPLPNLRTVLGELPKNAALTPLSSSSESAEPGPTRKHTKQNDNDPSNRSKRIRKQSTKVDSERYIVSTVATTKSNTVSSSTTVATDTSRTINTKHVTLSSSASSSSQSKVSSLSKNIPPLSSRSLSTSVPVDPHHSHSSSSVSSSSSSSASLLVTPPPSRKYSQQQRLSQASNTQTTSSTTLSSVTPIVRASPARPRPSFDDYMVELQIYHFFLSPIIDIPRPLELLNPNTTSSSLSALRLCTGIHHMITSPITSDTLVKISKDVTNQYPIDLYNYHRVPRLDLAEIINLNRHLKGLVCDEEFTLPKVINVTKITDPVYLAQNYNIYLTIKDSVAYVSDKRDIILAHHSTPVSKIKSSFISRYIVANDRYLSSIKKIIPDTGQELTELSDEQSLRNYAFHNPVFYVPSSLHSLNLSTAAVENEMNPIYIPYYRLRNDANHHECCRGYTGRNEKGEYILCTEKLQQPFYINNVLSPEFTMVPSLQTPDYDNILPPNWSKDYLQQLYQCNRERETSATASPDFLRHHPHVSVRTRAMILDILIDIHHMERLHPETLYLAMNLFDRYLEHTRSISASECVPIVLTCLWIASKHEEEWQKELHIDRLGKYISTSLKTDIKQLESVILTALQFRISVPTLYNFFTYYCIVGKVKEFSPVALLTLYIIELCLVRYRFLEYKPSFLTAAAFNMALRTFHGPQAWTEEIAEEIGYQEKELTSLIHEIETIIFGHTPDSPLPFIESYVFAPRSILFKYTDLSRYRIALQPILPLQ